MKLVTPCCQNVQEYVPRKNFNWKKRHKTACKQCGKNFDIKKDLVIVENGEEKGEIRRSIPPQNPSREPSRGMTIDIPKYNVNIKSYIKYDAIREIHEHGPHRYKAWDILSRPEYIEQGEIKDNIYWTSDIPPYSRPTWLYPWQEEGIQMMRLGHCMWQASRQKPGKTTAAGIADFEDMLEVPGTVVSVFAPTVPVAKTLMRQMFKETITLEDGTKFDLWNQLFKPYFIVDNVLEKVMKNGSRVQCITLDYKAVQGLASDVIHIEELDKAVREPQKLEAIAALFPQIRARRGKAKIRITCNNASGVYRIFRDELKEFGIYFPIYMEKPAREGGFTGEHFIYNDHVVPEKEPDVDEILEKIMFAVMGEGYVAQQLYNVDDYEEDLFNPDKLERAYKRPTPSKTKFEHAVMGIDPGAVHAFAITIYGMDGMDVTHLWTARFSISQATTKEDEQSMLKTLAKTCALAYIKYHCEICASESNSGARLIIPLIGHYVNKYLSTMHGESYAVWREKWSNFGGDSEQGMPPKMVQRSDFIMLMQYLLDYEMINLKDETTEDHIMRMEFARYDPTKKGSEDFRYKGDCVDSSLHACWWLCGGKVYIQKLAKMHQKRKIYAL